MRIVLADTAGEYNRIHAAHSSSIAADVLGQLVADHALDELIALVAFLGALLDVAVVAGYLRNAQDTGLLVHDGVDLIGSEILLLHEQRNDRGIDGTAAGTHHDAFQGSQTHGGIEALAVLNGSDGRTVAQMAGNDLQILTAQHFSGTQGYVTVGGTVEAVAADAVLLIVLIGQRIHICVVGHGLVEAGVEHSYLGHAGHHSLASADTGQVVRIVERTKFAALFDGCNNIFVHDHGTGELLTTVENAMSYCGDFRQGLDHTVLGRYEGVQNQLNSLFVVSHLDIQLVILTAVCLELEVTASDTDTVAHTLSDHLFGSHIDQLILDRGASGVDNKNLHSENHPFVM